ncbi:MAG TPA: glycosyltransferase family A protein [Allosphingosinicella sp.]|nr:glycosyltransferase family A protein [Allosphingosinicella sp.]
MPAPETSVIIPVRNGERYLGEAIGSALLQLGGDDEILVVDDASSDSSREVASSTGDVRVKIVSAAGRGVSAARNLGIGEARGRFIAFLDHDDLWPEGRHRMLKAMLERNPGAAAAFGRIRILEEADAPDPGGSAHLDGVHLLTNVGAHLYRAAAVRQTGGFAEDLHFGEDADFQFRLAEHELTQLCCDGDSLVYRRHGGNATNDTSAARRGLIAVARRKRHRAAGRFGP